MKSNLDKLLDFLNNFSLEIRPPLSAVLGYSEILKSEGLSAPDGQEYLESLNMAAKRVKNACDELLMLAFSFRAKKNLGTDQVCLESMFKEVEQTLNDDYWLNYGSRVYKFKIDADNVFLINANQELLKLAFLWLFCDVLSYYHNKKKECIIFINIEWKFDLVQIILSNLTDDLEQQKNKLDETNSVFVEFALETISNNSGTIETKLDSDGKPFIVITFPRITP
jgi:signal transduction histidine kinase